jgi:C1A family cysteine protease
MHRNGHVIIAAVLMALAVPTMAQDWIGADGPTYEVERGVKAQAYATGLVLPKGWESAKVRAESHQFYAGELPARWDWREHGKLGPIKQQGSCGSCWAFSAYATMSDVMALHGKGNIDLAEQHLVSCEPESYGCGGGWYSDAFALIQKSGSVLEKDFPYAGKDLKCPASLPKFDKIIGYKVLAQGIADTEAIKRAIYTYGPVSVAFSASGDFMSYKSGIYNSGASGQVNHAVNLVGWNDEVKPGHWIMRNSWGESWGEKGYCRIAYKAKQIGYATAYIDYAGPIPHDGIKPTPTPEPTPGPVPPKPCEPCSFWRWISELF